MDKSKLSTKWRPIPTNLIGKRPLQTIVVSINDTLSRDDTFLASFPNIFVNYHLGEMRTTDMKWINWNKAPLRLWQTQLNFAVFWASSACEVSSEHLNYKKHSMIRSLYRFHVRQVFKRLQVPLPRDGNQF